MRKHLSAAHARARAARTCLGVVTGSLVIIGLTACGGGGDPAPSNEQTQPQSLRDTSQAQALTAAATVPAAGLITGEGWAAQPPVMPNATTYTTPTVSGKAYYIDSSISSDEGHNGSIDQPWKYLWRAGQKKDWAAGDAILLKCGSVWRDQSLALNGGADPTVKTGLIVAAYGCDQNPNRPVISGASPLPLETNTSWSAVSGQTGVQTIALTKPIKRLYRNGQVQTPARFPNEVNGKRFAITAELARLANESDAALETRKKSFFKINDTDRQTIGDNTIKGATVYVRTNPYTVEAARVKTYTPSTGVVELETALKFPIEPTAGYILEGKPWMVDQAGEWAMDGNTLRYASAAPVTSELLAVIPRKSSSSADVPTIGLWLAQVDKMQIEHLRLEYNDTSIDLDNSPDVKIRDIESAHAYDGGILASNSPRLQILGSRIDHSGLNGIRIFTSADAKVAGNVVSNTGSYRVANPEGAGVQPGISLQGWAVRVQGERTLVENNLVQDSANVGIAFSDEAGTIVRNNTVLRPCLLLTDCGGIYTSNVGAVNTTTGQLTPSTPNTAMTSQVYGNLVAGLRSNLDGSFIRGALRDLIAGENQANGIYLDDGTNTVEVFNNVIAGAEVGIFLHNSAYNSVHDNVTQGITYASLFVSSDSTKNAWITRGNRIANNTLFSRRTVDAAAFNKVPYKGVRGELTHAQLWLHTTQNARTFFQDSAAGVADRNISSGNKTVTLSSIPTKSVWRMEAADSRGGEAPGVPLVLRMEQISGAAWGLKSFYDPIEQLGRSEWLAITGGNGVTPDTESSPVSYRTHMVTSSGTPALSPKSISWTPVGGSASLLTGTKCPASLPTGCFRFVATSADDRFTSMQFNVTSGTLYQVDYILTAGATQPARHSAHIGASNTPSTIMNVVSPLIDLKAGEVRKVETYVRPALDGAVRFAHRASDGTPAWFNKEMFFSGGGNSTYGTSVQALSNTISVLPPLRTLGFSAVNASAEARTFTCADLGIAASSCAKVVTAENKAAVTFPVSVPARSVSRFYVNNAWME